MVSWRQHSVREAVRPTSPCQSTGARRLDGIKWRLVSDDASLRVPKSLRTPVQKGLNICIRRQKSSKNKISNECKKRRLDAHTLWSITSSLNNDSNPALTAAQSQAITVDPSFLDYIWKLEVMATGQKCTLTPIHEMSAQVLIEEYSGFKNLAVTSRPGLSSSKQTKYRPNDRTR